LSAPPPSFLAENIRPDDQRPADTAVTERTPIAWKRVFRFLLPYWRQEALLIVGMVAGIGLSLVYPLLFRDIVDDVIGAGAHERLLPLAGMILGATTLGVALSAAAGWLQTWVTSRVLVDLRLELFTHLQRLGPAFFARKRLGDILSRMGGDLGELQSVATGTLLNVLGSAITLVAVVSALSVLQPLLLLIGAAFVPVAAVLLVMLRPVIRRLSLRIRERNADISHHMLESLQSIRTVRAHGLAGREADRFRAHNNALVRAVLTFSLWSSASAGLFQVLVTANLLAVLVVGVGMVGDGSLSTGDLLAFLLFQQRLYGPLQGLSGTYVNLQRASAPVARVFELLDAQPLGGGRPGTRSPEVLEGRIAFEDVGFAYGPGRVVLDAVSFEVPPGTTTAVVGPSGVGKSTLVDLLFGFLPPQRGRVLLDGVPLDELDLEAALPFISMVTQAPALFDATLRDNLRWLEPSAEDEDLWPLLDRVGLAGFVRELPEGLDTPLGDRGVRLSAGQQQRVGLARALLRKPVLLVLDEVTAALDWESDQVVVQTLQERRRAGLTTLVITHRLSLSTDADQVVVLDESKVAEIGRHEDLVGGNGLYARLWRLQRGESA
jgi:ABC-type multidrug transport system fused ATPase/permease subunit